MRAVVLADGTFLPDQMTEKIPEPTKQAALDDIAARRAESVMRAAEYVESMPAGEPINPDAITQDPAPEEIEEELERGV